MPTDEKFSREPEADEVQTDDQDAALEESEEQDEEDQVVKEADANEEESPFK